MQAPSLLELCVERFADLLAGGAVVEAAPGDGGDGLGSLLASLPAPVREGLARALSCRHALDAALLARLAAPRDLRALRLRGGGPPLGLGDAVRACGALDVLVLQNFRGGGDVGAALDAVGHRLVELDLCESEAPPDALRDLLVGARAPRLRAFRVDWATPLSRAAFAGLAAAAGPSPAFRRFRGAREHGQVPRSSSSASADSRASTGPTSWRSSTASRRWSA